MLKVATAFSGGFGSVEFALKYLDIQHEVVFACEWMKPQRESYILNHGEPTSNFYEDIRTLDGTKYKDEIDYYHLSPPCQSYSLAGSRGGAADERGGLMFEAIKSIDEVQPKMFSVENVKGLLSSNNGEDWKNIIRDFKSLKGYTISWGVMNAKEQGTPQNRERVFIVGFRGQAPQFSFPVRQELKITLKDLLCDVVDDKYFLSEKMIKCFNARKEISKGYEFKPQNGERHANCLSVKYGNYSTDTYLKINSNTKGLKIRRLTPREVSRAQGDFKDMFKFGKASDTKLYEFIGNAMDINTTKNLIARMLDHLKNNVKLNQPIDSTFKKKETVSQNLFDLETA